MSIPPLSQAPRCVSHGGVKVPTAESNCTLWNQNRNFCESLVAFKATIRRNPFRGEHIFHERKDLKEKKIFAKPKILTLQCHEHLGVMYSAESNFSNFVIEYLGEIETEF